MIDNARPPESVGVLICTYRRPDSLARGLAALAAQHRLPDDVIIVVRGSDTQSRNYLEQRPADVLKIRIIVVSLPGTVHALNAGLESCQTDVLAITDDDTAPHADWLARILAHFVADPRLGGLGGRDRCHDGERFDDKQAKTVGHISWYGRAVGNHHIGFGPVRDVHNLKGANMSYRASAIANIRFDRRLRGDGAQHNEDATFSLAVRRAGWRVRYDPQVLVDHYAARTEVRHYSSVSRIVDVSEFRSFAYNDVVMVWDEFSFWRHSAFIVWSLLIGTGVSPGLLQAFRYTPTLGVGAWHRFFLMQESKLRAYFELLTGRTRCPEVYGSPLAVVPRSDRNVPQGVGGHE